MNMSILLMTNLVVLMIFITSYRPGRFSTYTVYFKLFYRIMAKYIGEGFFPREKKFGNYCRFLENYLNTLILHGMSLVRIENYANHYEVFFIFFLSNNYFLIFFQSQQ